MQGKPNRRLMTHSQYEELRRFKDGNAHYVYRSAATSLTKRGWLARVPKSGETRVSSAWRITEEGVVALKAYEARWKIAGASASLCYAGTGHVHLTLNGAQTLCGLSVYDEPTMPRGPIEALSCEACYEADHAR